MTMYEKVIEFVGQSGERIRDRAGDIADIGITKQFLTEEDLRIEREFGELIKTFDGEHVLYAEEEHDFAQDAENIWVMDPISGTNIFISGLPHYGIVVSHIQNGKIKFAAVYDPSMRNMYTAMEGKGTSLNGKIKSVESSKGKYPRVLVAISPDAWDSPEMLARFATKMKKFNISKLPYSLGVCYAYVASGKFDGIIALTKDTFPEFAGSLLVREAGGLFSNIAGSSGISPRDRVFVAGTKEIQPLLLEITRGINPELA
jgi:myo-inositol-1(or 4)-monophosphatase